MGIMVDSKIPLIMGTARFVPVFINRMIQPNAWSSKSLALATRVLSLTLALSFCVTLRLLLCPVL